MANQNRIHLSKSEQLEHLKEQISFLLESSRGFDGGNFIEAKRIANSLRILLHDTKSSKSLLGQLGVKNYHFINTCLPYDPENLAPYVPLLSFKFSSKLGYRPWIVPLGNPKERPRRYLMRFSDWWNMPVIKTPKKYARQISFCRREIILNVANTDGGSHIDPTIDKKYAALSRWNAIGVVTEQNGIEQPIDNPILPCVRQIAHEVILVLESRYKKIFPYDYTFIISEDPPEGSIGTGVPTKCSLGFPDIL